MATMASLPPTARAAFAVTSRLLSCLITESLLRAYYLPIEARGASGVLVVLSTHTVSETPVLNRTLGPADVLVLVPLRSSPVLWGDAVQMHGQKVALVDPLDMLPHIYELSESAADLTHVSPGIRGHLISLTYVY